MTVAMCSWSVNSVECRWPCAASVTAAHFLCHDAGRPAETRSASPTRSRFHFFFMLVEIETLTSSLGAGGLCASGRRHGRSRGVDQLQLFFTVAPMASSRPPVPQVALEAHSLIAAKLMGKSLPSFSGTSRSTDAWHSHSVAALVREVDETSREAA